MHLQLAATARGLMPGTIWGREKLKSASEVRDEERAPPTCCNVTVSSQSSPTLKGFAVETIDSECLVRGQYGGRGEAPPHVQRHGSLQ